jgi:PAS domain S-box-containing protein
MLMLSPSRDSVKTDEGNMQNARFFKSLALMLVLAGVYYVVAKQGLKLASEHPSASAVWPPTGIALAALLVLGHRVWPGIWLGAFLANITTQGSVATTLGIATGNTLEGVVGAWLVNRFAHGRNAFDHALDYFKFVILATVVSPMISATFGVTSLALGGFATWANYGSIWMTWWLGDVTGGLVVAPLLILWSGPNRIRWDLRQWLEAGALMMLLVFVALTVFGGLFPARVKDYPLEFLCLPFLVWTAFRFSPRETVTAIALLSGIAIWGTLNSFGPFVRGTQNESLLLLQAFLGVSTMMALALAANVHEHKQAALALRQSRERFQQITETITEVFYVTDVESGQVLYVSPAYETIWRRTCDSLYRNPRSFLEAVLPEDRERVVQALERQQRGELTDEEYKIQVLGGEIYWIHDRAYPMRDATGRVYRVTGIAEDITGRKRVQEALREADERMVDVLNNITDGFVALDNQWRFTYINKHAEQIFVRMQKQPGGHLGKCAWDEFPDLVGSKLDVELRRAVSQQVPVSFEFFYPALNCWFDNHAYPSPEGLAVYFNDITARKRAERRVAAFASLGRQLNSASEIKTAAHIIVQVADELFGWDSCTLDIYNVERGTCHPVLNIDLINGQRRDVPPRFVDERPTGRMGQVLAGHGQLILREQPVVRTPDMILFGDTSRPSASIMIVPVSHGEKVIGALSIQSYRTNAYTQADLDAFQALADHCGGALEQIRGRKALQQSEARNRAMLESALDAIITIDHEGRIIEFNPAAEQMFGLLRPQTVGQLMAELIIPPSLRERHRQGLARYLATGETSILGKRIEMLAMRSNGREFPIELSITRVGPKEPPMFAGFVRDITERKRADAELQASLLEKEVLLKEVNHRVKNNLQVVSSLLHLQSDQNLDPATRELFKESENRVKSMALIHESLYRSKKLSQVHFGEYVQRLTADLFRSFGVDRRIIGLKINIPDVRLSIDTAIPCGLIINELVSNILKYAFPNGRAGEIAIDLLPGSDRKLTLCVRDNGIGFPPGLDFTQTSTLGLQLVTSLVYQLRGTVELQANAGTEFRITFANNAAEQEV